MSTGVKVLKPGDLKNAINSLERNIRNISITFAKDEMELLKQGDVDMCLKLLRVMLFEVSHDMAKEMIMRGCSSIASNKKILLVCSDILRERAKIPPTISAENFCTKGYAEHKLILLNHVAQYVHINSKSIIKSNKDLNISDYSDSNKSKTTPINTNVPPTVLPQNKVLVQYDQLISVSSVDNQSNKNNNMNNNIDDVLRKMEDIEIRTSKLFKSNDLNMNLALNNDTKNKMVSSPQSFKKTITGKEVIIDNAIFTKTTPTKTVSNDTNTISTSDIETIIDSKFKELSASLLEKQKLLFIDYTNNINSKLLLLENRIKLLESKK